jgi:acetyl-CoA carboxylase biotin carboxyl carrier protein
MDLKLLQRLIRIMKRSELTELEVDDKPSGLRVHLSRGGVAPPPAPLLHVMQAPAPVGPAPSSFSGAVPVQPAARAAPETPVGHAITSPMVGTFYRSSAPDAEPFVHVGSRIKPDAPLCIIEAMKVMNEIKAEKPGKVLQILVENGEAVEYGQPLFLIQR